MSKNNEEREIVIVGGGMSGTVFAYIMAESGYRVKIYEKRADCRKDLLRQGKSVNLTLAERGIRSLEKIGISREQLFGMCMGLKGRQVHQANGKSKFQPYGKTDDQVIYSIIRNDLNCFLLSYVEKHPNIEILFNQQCIEVDKSEKTISFRDCTTGEKYKLKPQILIGADGTFSKVRTQMQKGIPADYTQFYLDAGYKELYLPPDENGNYRMDKNYLHVFPRGETLMLALTNNDGSFTCTCVLPNEEASFPTLHNKETCKDFFENYFPDFIEIMPEAIDKFHESPTNKFITTKTSVWFYEDWIALIGDACHTVTPFYGQGMNTALEGCWVLAECMKKHKNDLNTAFREYQEIRKINTDILADISVKNYYELRDKVRYPSIDFKKKVNFLVQNLFPDRWLPLYTMIAHTEIPYAQAVEIEKKQNRILNLFGVGAVSALMDFGAYLWLTSRRILNGNRKQPNSGLRPDKTNRIVKKQGYMVNK